MLKHWNGDSIEKRARVSFNTLNIEILLQEDLASALAPKLHFKFPTSIFEGVLAPELRFQAFNLHFSVKSCARASFASCRQAYRRKHAGGLQIEKWIDLAEKTDRKTHHRMVEKEVIRCCTVFRPEKK